MAGHAPCLLPSKTAIGNSLDETKEEQDGERIVWSFRVNSLKDQTQVNLRQLTQFANAKCLIFPDDTF